MEASRSGCGAMTSRQAHVGLPPGTVEEEHSRSGFYGPASHLYRLHPPTDWTSRHRPRRAPGLRHEPPRRRRPRAWTTTCGRRLLLGNDEVSIGVQRYVRGRPEFLRDADGDELFFVHAGTGAAAHRVRPARATASATTSSCPAAPPTGSSRPSRPCSWPSRRTGRASRCPSGACSVATPCSTRRSSRCPRPRRSTRRATSRSWSSGTATARSCATRSTRATSSGGRATSPRCGSTSTTSGRSRRPATTCRRRPTRRGWPTASSCARSRRGRWRRTPRRCACRSSTATSTTTR